MKAVWLNFSFPLKGYHSLFAIFLCLPFPISRRLLHEVLVTLLFFHVCFYGLTIIALLLEYDRDYSSGLG
jgi:hypothetical protein